MTEKNNKLSIDYQAIVVELTDTREYLNKNEQYITELLRKTDS